MYSGLWSKMASWFTCAVLVLFVVECISGKQPNFVVVLTDDQDVLLGEWSTELKLVLKQLVTVR